MEEDDFFALISSAIELALWSVVVVGFPFRKSDPEVAMKSLFQRKWQQVLSLLNILLYKFGTKWGVCVVCKAKERWV
jgi:hypothetical protein